MPRTTTRRTCMCSGSDLEVLVEIGTWRILARYGRTAAIAPALAWAQANEPLLRARWAELNPRVGDDDASKQRGNGRRIGSHASSRVGSR